MLQVSRRSAALATLAGSSATVAITVAQAFLLIPLALLHLEPSLYGAWLAATEVLIWIQLLDGGLPNLLTQRAGAAVGRGDHVDAARWASTCFAGLGVIASVLLAGALWFAPLIGAWSQAPIGDRELFVDCFRTGVVASVLLLLANGGVGLSRGVQRTGVVNAAQVAGALGGLVVSIILLLAGAGLWAFPIGLLTRAVIAVVGGAFVLWSLPAPRKAWLAWPSTAYATEIFSLVPSMSAGSVGHVIASNSEIILVNTFFGPVPALAYALTRRAFDGARSLLDTIAWAVAGGFAHLVTAGDGHRARGVMREVLWARLAVACLGTGTVLAVNQPLVGLLFGPANFGGVWLSLAFALQTLATGQSFLANFLWRATGNVRDGSWFLAIEAGARILMMTLGLSLFGVAGAPFAAVAVSVVMLYVTQRRCEASLPQGPLEPVPATAWLAPFLVLIAGWGIALVLVPRSWIGLGSTLVLFGGGGAILLWSVRPRAGVDGTILRWRFR